MHVNSIGIFTNPKNEGALDAVEAVRLAASVRGISCFIDKSLLDIEQFKGLDTTETNTPDLMVAMGGDGTILRAAGYAAEKEVPLLGINFGRVGFLSEIDVESFSTALDAIKKEEFTLDRCMMLACCINGGEPVHCLNEAVLYRKNFSGVVSINVNINGAAADAHLYKVCAPHLLGKGIGYGKGYYVNENDGYNGKGSGIPEGILEAGIADSLNVVTYALPLCVFGRVKFAERKVNTLNEGPYEADHKRQKCRPDEERSPFFDGALY